MELIKINNLFKQIDDRQRDEKKRDDCTRQTDWGRMAEKKSIQIMTGIIKLFDQWLCFEPGVQFIFHPFHRIR